MKPKPGERKERMSHGYEPNIPLNLEKYNDVRVVRVTSSGANVAAVYLSRDGKNGSSVVCNDDPTKACGV
ncbi:hypothetical protein O3P69_013246 [Scylla paramamosain]|uniref:Uncharacterized protein n=1 Tax=Scylla paramamosain TaxID=85552 RepID=A0AAW0U169_SCYPA